MFKKLIIATAVLATTSSLAFADGVPYVGASLGYGKNSYSLKDPNSVKTNMNSNGVIGGLFAGYGVTLSNNIYLGGEGFVNGGTQSTSNKAIANLSTRTQLTSKYSYGLDFVPGYKVTPTTLVYGKVGVVRTQFKQAQSLVVGAPANAVAGSNTNTVTGGRLGLGVQTEVATNVAVRGEFVHTSYNSFSSLGNRISPKNNQVNFGLVYSFG